jgi:predicted RND superfamily exporter protein
MKLFLNGETVAVFIIACGISIVHSIYFAHKWRSLDPLLPKGEAVSAVYTSIAKPLVLSAMILLTAFLSLLFSDFKLVFVTGIVGSLIVISSLKTTLFLVPLLIQSYYGSAKSAFPEKIR